MGLGVEDHQLDGPNPNFKGEEMTWGWLLTVAAKLFGYLLKQATPYIKAELEDQLKALYLKAVETENPFDDHIMAMVLEMLAIEKPTIK